MAAAAACRYCGAELPAPLESYQPPVAACGRCGLYWLMQPPGDGGKPAAPPTSGSPDPTEPNRETEAELLKLRGSLPDFPPGASVLDVGSADGAWLASLARSGYAAHGIEPSERLVEVGRARGIDGLHAGRFDAKGIPPALRDRTFDLISFRESLYYMSDLGACFELVRKLLNPHGKLYIKSHVADSAYYGECRDYTSRYGSHVQAMPTLRAMEFVLNREGFRLRHWRNLEFTYLNDLGSSVPARAIRKAGARLLARARSAQADRIAVVAEKNS